MSNNNPIDAQLSMIYIDSGAVDPSITAVGGTKGTIFIQVGGVGSPQLFQKQDEGTTINWTPVGGGGGGGANTALSNLIATSINQNLVSDANNTRSLGSAANQWVAVYTGQVASLGGGASLSVTTGSGLFSADLSLATGNAGAGDSGDINLFTGTATGTQGVINFNTDFVPTISTAFSIFGLQRIFSNIAFLTHIRDVTNDDVMEPNVRKMYFPAAFGGTAMDFGGDNIIGFLTNTVLLDSKYTSGFSSPGSPSLVFNSPNLSIIATIDNNLADATPTSDLYFKSGSKLNGAATNDTGALYIGTGINQGTGNSGNVNISSGDANIGNSGDISLNAPPPSSGTRGSIYLSGSRVNLFDSSPMFFDPAYTPSYWGVPTHVFMAESSQIPVGDVFILGSTDVNSGAASDNSADIGFQTGDNNNGVNPTGKTGDMWLTTGYQNLAGASGDTGLVDFGTGSNSGTGASGIFSIYTGAAAGGSGAFFIYTGIATGAIKSGDITCETGANTGTGDSGDQFLLTGNTTVGDSGNVTISSGVAAGNSGNVIVHSQTAGGTRGNVIVGGGIAYTASGQTPGAAFTLTSNESYAQLNPAGAVTSSAVTAIAAGRIAGQILVLHNISAFTITLKNGALTQLPSAIDFALTANSTISFIWSGSIWVTTAASGN